MSAKVLQFPVKAFDENVAEGEAIEELDMLRQVWAARAENAALRAKALAKPAKRAAKPVVIAHDSKVGDILETSWGYDQTNIDFYEVVAVKPKSVVVRAVASAMVEGGGRGSDLVVPQPGRFTGEPMLCRMCKHGGFRVDGHWGHRWDGKPSYQTAAGYGH